MNKPLFIPLKTEYFEAFLRGEKKTEYRAYGPRWNFKTCQEGRLVILSKGYGKQYRLVKRITSTEITAPTEDFKKIYGDKRQCLAIHLENL